MEKTKKVGLVKPVIAALITAIILVMSFTPLGYLKTPVLEISFLAIPVTIGSILLGTKWGAYFGALFGLTSFIQCFGMSAFGVVLLSINPFYTFIICFVPRVLMGIGIALIFKGLQNITKGKAVPYAVASLSGAILNTIFFMSALLIFFYQSDYLQGIASKLGTKNALTFAIALVGTNGLIEALVAFVVTLPVAVAVSKYAKRYSI